MTFGGVVNAEAIATIRFAGSLPKSGGQMSECEDRFCASTDSGIFRVAVADGASASLLAGEWAELLATAFCEASDLNRSSLAESINSQAQAWNQMSSQRDLPWYARAKRESGAFAAFVGVDIRPDGQWMAAAVGDSCLFHVRRSSDDQTGVSSCLQSFPLSRTGQFGNTPSLIGTKIALEAGQLVRTEAKWHAGDDLYLMTDALAEWFLGELQQNREPWRWFDALESQAGPMPFDRLASDLRASGKLKDDDMTLLHIRLSSDGREAKN